MTLQELTKVIKITDPNTHLKALVGANKLLILKFYTQTCPPCKLLQERFEQMELDGKLDKVFVLSIDAKEYPQLAESYKVKSVPAIFALKNGEVIGEARGSDEVNKLLEIHLRGYK